MLLSGCCPYRNTVVPKASERKMSYSPERYRGAAIQAPSSGKRTLMANCRWLLEDSVAFVLYLNFFFRRNCLPWFLWGKYPGFDIRILWPTMLDSSSAQTQRATSSWLWAVSLLANYNPPSDPTINGTNWRPIADTSSVQMALNCPPERLKTLCNSECLILKWY